MIAGDDDTPAIESLQRELERCQRELEESRQRMAKMEAIAAHERAERQQTVEKLNLLNVELAQQAAKLKDVNQTLLDSEQRLRIAIETGRIGLFVWDSTQLTNPGDWSKQLKEIFGLPLDADVTHDMFLKCVHPEDREHIDQCVMRALQGENGGEYKTEYRTIRPDDGSEHWVTARGQAFFDSAGKPVRFIGTVMDITERKRAEQSLSRLNAELEERIAERVGELSRANQSLQNEITERKRIEDQLRQNQAYLAEAQSLSRTGSFGWNISTGEIIWSKETYGIFAYDLTQKPTLEMVFDRIDPGDLVFVRQTLGSITHGETFLDFEHRLQMPDGKTKHVHVVARAVQFESGKVEFVGAVMDITERKLAQEALRSAKARFEGILEIAEDAIISVDSNQHIILFNQGAQKVFGYAENDVIGKSLDFLLPQRFAGAHRLRVEEFAQSVEISRSMARRRAVFGRRKDGSEFPAEASISKLKLDQEVVFTVILRDITEQKRLEDRLRQSEKNLAEGQRLTKTGSWILDFKTGNTDWSVETCRIFGFPDPPPSPHYSEFRARVRPEDRESVDEGLRESFETGEPRPLKYIFVLPDGTRKNIETISEPVKDHSGRVLKLMGTVMDVTQRQQAEDALRASELLARGQTEALTRALDAMARESSPDKIVEQVLRNFTTQLDALSSSVWLRNESSGLMAFEFALEGGVLRTKTQAQSAQISPPLSIEDVWPWPEVFRTGKPYLLEDIREGPGFPWRAQVVAQGVISILVVPMLVSGVVMGVIGIRFNKKRAFRVEELELAQALTNQVMLAMQLIRLSEQSREAAVIAERNRMARDIHDALAEGFTGVIVQLEAAADAASKSLVAEAQNHLARAGKMARYGLSEARRSVHALRFKGQDDCDLCSALDALLRRATTDTGLHADFVLRGVPQALPPEWEDNVLRITQEVLTNALRHAHATHFNATFQFEKKHLTLKLSDDGCGFDATLKSDGFGLMGMRERVEQMNGQISIESAKGAGTTILITLPLQDVSQT